MMEYKRRAKQWEVDSKKKKTLKINQTAVYMHLFTPYIFIFFRFCAKTTNTFLCDV